MLRRFARYRGGPVLLVGFAKIDGRRCYGQIGKRFITGVVQTVQIAVGKSRNITFVERFDFPVGEQ